MAYLWPQGRMMKSGTQKQSFVCAFDGSVSTACPANYINIINIRHYTAHMLSVKLHHVVANLLCVSQPS